MPRSSMGGFSPPKPKWNWRLAGATVTYWLVGFVSLGLAAKGILHPPWGLFQVLFFAPLLAGAAVLLIKVSTGARLFGWVAVLFFITAMLLTAAGVAWVACEASASV